MSPRKLYILDDDPLYRKLCRQVLGNCGWQVADCNSVSDVDLAQLDASSVLLLDLLMQGSDGLDFIATLEARKFGGSVLLMTGVELEGAAEVVHRLLFSRVLIAGILHKPFLADDLVQAVTQASSRDQVLPFSAESLELIEVTLQSRQFDIRHCPVMDAASGRIVSLNLDISALLGWQHFPLQRLDDLLVHSGLLPAWLQALIAALMEVKLTPESWARLPMTLPVSARLCTNEASRAALLAALDTFADSRDRIHLLFSHRDCLLQGPALLAGLQQLREQGCTLIMDGIRPDLHFHAAATSQLFDELRLASTRLPDAGSGNSAAADLRILALLHRRGQKLTVRNPYAWITLSPDSAFRPELFSGTASLRSALGVQGTTA